MICVLSWRTVSALIRVLICCLFPSLLRYSGHKHQNNPLVNAETVCHSSIYIILYETWFNMPKKLCNVWISRQDFLVQKRFYYCPVCSCVTTYHIIYEDRYLWHRYRTSHVLLPGYVTRGGTVGRVTGEVAMTVSFGDPATFCRYQGQGPVITSTNTVRGSIIHIIPPNRKQGYCQWGVGNTFVIPKAPFAIE